MVLRHEVMLDGPKAWIEIPGLEDVSGIGRYSTTIELGNEWTGGHGAYLDLGEVFDTFQVAVNGWRLSPVDQVNSVVDIGPHLESGTNTIEVEVATTLSNRLRVSNPEVFGSTSRQRYGLIGPVKLIPYEEAVIWPPGPKPV